MVEKWKIFLFIGETFRPCVCRVGFAILLFEIAGVKSAYTCCNTLRTGSSKHQSVSFGIYIY
jgi:hypothetical protein